VPVQRDGGDHDGGNVPARVRQERMLAAVESSEFVRVADLSERFQISEVTVRSDLDALAERGRLLRVRGGAVPSPRQRPELPFEQAATAHAAQKQAIGRAAAALVDDGETVLLDVGTTTTAIAQALVARADLRKVVVVTNGLNIALALEAAIPRFTVVVTGGTLRPLQHSLVDPLGGVLLDHVHPGLLFLGCNGIDAGAGVTNVNLPEAQVKRRMLAAARRRVVVADGSKVGQVAFARLCDLDEVDLLLTDEGADPEAVAVLRERGLEVQIA
jgi:DeoR family transcriptional regulator of aga operon